MRSLKVSPKKVVLNGAFPYERVAPKRPMVQRKGDKVLKCFLYDSTKECLGTRCFWPRCGNCATFNRLASKIKKTGQNGNGGWVKNGKLRKL